MFYCVKDGNIAGYGELVRGFASTFPNPAINADFHNKKVEKPR
jgi:hypothetical protein